MTRVQRTTCSSNRAINTAQVYGLLTAHKYLNWLFGGNNAHKYLPGSKRKVREQAWPLSWHNNNNNKLLLKKDMGISKAQNEKSTTEN